MNSQVTLRVAITKELVITTDLTEEQRINLSKLSRQYPQGVKITQSNEDILLENSQETINLVNSLTKLADPVSTTYLIQSMDSKPYSNE